MPDPMVLCSGCGFHREQEDIVKWCDEFCSPGKHALTCRKCTECPDMRECYRRGFNAGLDAMKRAVMDMVDKSNLRKQPSDDED